MQVTGLNCKIAGARAQTTVLSKLSGFFIHVEYKLSILKLLLAEGSYTEHIK